MKYRDFLPEMKDRSNISEAAHEPATKSLLLMVSLFGDRYFVVLKRYLLVEMAI